jgi:hypothetical protein
MSLRRLPAHDGERVRLISPPSSRAYTDEMLPWAKTPAVRGFRKFPPPEQFPALLAEFATRFASQM